MTARKSLLATFALMVLAGCGGGGGVPTGTASVNLSGTAGKGLLIGADVNAYEVINGTLSSQLWASAKTNSEGVYSLKGSPTNNPLVVVVTSNNSTQMLDESQPLSNGTFKIVAAPSNLKLRSFVEELKQNDTLQINALTESAVAMATNAVDTSNTRIGLTKNTLLAAKQFAQQLAPPGINPFTANLPAKVADLSDENMLGMGQMMAGLIQTANVNSSNCAVQCQIEKLSLNVTISVDANGKGSISSAQATAMTAQKRALLVTGKNALASKSSELGPVAGKVNKVAQEVVNTAQKSTVVTSTLTSSEYEALNGVQGFVNTLRASFRDSEMKLQQASDSLDQRYQKLTLQGLDQVSSVVNTALTDCIKEQEFKCTRSASSRVTWTRVGDNWEGTATTFDGYTVKGTISGSISNNDVRFAITNATIKSGSKPLVDLVNLNVSASSDTNSLGDATAANVMIDGNIKAYDQTPGSDMHLTLGLNDLEASFNEAGGTFNIKGKLSLASNKNDSLKGSLSISGKESATSVNGFTYKDNFITQMTLDLNASEFTQGEILSFTLNAERTLADMTKAIDANNFEKGSASLGITLAANTGVTLTTARTSWNKATASATLKSGTSKLNLTGNYTLAATANPNAWCIKNGSATFCTSTLALSANDGSYTGIVRKTSLGTAADLFKGSITSGTQIGVLTNKGMIQVNGQEYSLY